nr:PadR family transcriptional regulator [Mammaliicoccus sp. Marseille-Q6498]
MNIQFKKGALEFIVLLIIKGEDQYGYSLVQKITPRITISEGTVYPLLRRLVKDEFLTTYYEASTEGPARKYYKITDLGCERLDSLLDEWESFTGAVNLFLEESGESENNG